MKVTLLVLTLNEIDGMKVIMPQIKRHWCDQIIIVDGGSTDGTIEWARQQGYQVHVQTRPGIRYAYFEIIEKIEGDIVISFSPDGNCLAESIPALIAKMREGYDLVIGSRYLADATSTDDDLLTAFGNWLFTKTVNLLHGGHYTDAMTILRAFRISLIHDLDLTAESAYRLPERLFGTVVSWEPLMSVRAAKCRMRIAEVPASEPPRIGGKRKLQIFRWGAAYYFQFWQELFTWRRAAANRRQRALRSDAASEKEAPSCDRFSTATDDQPPA
jgi:glycosyltransferase involved in cell wall biosynthesis